VSSLGKGIVAASLGALLQAHGFKVRIRKMDPYLNVDPGTMSPLQHGEVFVTQDGAETDLDLGHYERFTGVHATRKDNITAGRIYQGVIARERQGGYLGATVQVIPHITDEIKHAIVEDTTQEDFVICEIGGTVGDIESLPFLEAIRQLANELGTEQVMFVHVTLLPWIETAGELKTKPTQHSVRTLLSLGISPHMLVCRTDRPIPLSERKKLSLFCNVKPSAVIEAKNVSSIYIAPLVYMLDNMDKAVFDHFGLAYTIPYVANWQNLINQIESREQSVTIGVVGKYVHLKDSYKSLAEALEHGGLANACHVKIRWIDCEKANLVDDLLGCDGILVPGGFGARGIQGKLTAITHARTHNIPFLGICLGMQLAVIEALHSAGWKDANSTEFGACSQPVVDILPGRNQHLGGTMRLGNYPAILDPTSLAKKIYQKTLIEERHRHRYEVVLNTGSSGHESHRHQS
jgi:CTP synthase